jgi:hypothetical protein
VCFGSGHHHLNSHEARTDAPHSALNSLGTSAILSPRAPSGQFEPEGPRNHMPPMTRGSHAGDLCQGGVSARSCVLTSNFGGEGVAYLGFRIFPSFIEV